MHTIHNIAFEVDVNHDGQHIYWEEYYKNFFQDRLLPKIERLCNNWDAKYPNTKCSIDEIDIDIEVNSIHLEELQEEIITKIEDQLSNINKNETANHGSVRATITSLASPFEALVKYLKDGVLPATISVKNFKEWLGNVIQFTSDEKEALTTLFISNTLTIERMLSLLRNDYEKFAAILETKQEITKQYLKLEITFFKKFLKIICEKAQLSYQEAQAEIWFKTLGVSSSLAQFSKTFIQLLQPKAVADKKRLVNTNEHQLSVAMLQAIVQHDIQKSIHISVAKIFTIVPIKTEATSTENTLYTKNTAKNSTTKNTEEIQNKNKVDKTIKSQNSSTEQTKNITKVNQDAEVLKETKSSKDTNQPKNQKNTNPKSQHQQPNKDAIQDKSSQTSNEVNTTKTTDQTEITNQESNHRTQSAENTISTSKKAIRNNIDANTVQHTNDTTVDSQKQQSQQHNVVDNSENKNSDKAKKEANAVDETITARKVIQEAVHKNNQEGNSKTPEKEVDNTLFERLAKNNIPLKEIPLTTEKAGLIILNPFLAQFFKGAKLVNNNNEITNEGKACMLLHYLATATEEVTDVELTLEKICLGIPLDTIINYQTPLTEEDKALCEELLQAVIQHWAVLKNSSSNTIRDMFLKREGNITVKEDGIKLVIERFAQDILLDKIPWSIGLFQLKWMDKMMHVEW